MRRLRTPGRSISRITYIDGDQGILRYRGYRIEDLAERCDFIEVAYLLIYGELPAPDQLQEFRMSIRRHTLLHEGMKAIFAGFPPDAHPMAILSSVVGALAIYCKDSLDPKNLEERRAGDLPHAWPRCRRSRPSATSSRSASRSSIRRTI